MICKKCGTELPDSAKFCGKCGTKIEKDIFCMSCGAKIPAGNNFCMECGTPICESANLEANSARISTHLKESFDYDFMRFHQFHQWQGGKYSATDDAVLVVGELSFLKINRNLETIDQRIHDINKVLSGISTINGTTVVGYGYNDGIYSFYIQSIDDNGRITDSKMIFSTSDLPTDIRCNFMTCREALMSEDNIIVLFDHHGDVNETIVCNYSLSKEQLTHHVFDCPDSQFNSLLSRFNYDQSILSDDGLYLIENKVGYNGQGFYDDPHVVRVDINTWEITTLASVPERFYRLLDIKNKIVWADLGINERRENGFDFDKKVFGAIQLSKNGKLLKTKGLWILDLDMFYFDGTRAFKKVPGGVVEINKEGSVKKSIIEGITIQIPNGEEILANPNNMTAIIWEERLICVVRDYKRNTKAVYVDLDDKKKTVHEMVVVVNY